MNRELALQVANAVLYEGYMLYPYRPSAVKNQQRWTFGILYPPGYQEVQRGTERSVMHSEFLLETTQQTVLHLQLRFLHLVTKQIEQPIEGRRQPVPSLLVDGTLIESREEAVERELEFEFDPAGNERLRIPFSFSGGRATEPLPGTAGSQGASLNSTQHEVTGTVFVSSEELREGLVKLTVEVGNTTDLPPDAFGRQAALLRSLLSAHTILSVNSGEFVSLLDPSEDLRKAAKSCTNLGNLPVLVGVEGERDMLLCSPILLYDYPQIAPESAGDFYDSTEMDEMLTLRVLTLTDEEKNQMRLGDERVRELLRRTEQTARQQLGKTHGTIRKRPALSEKLGGRRS